jgi:hypothetical protein
MLETYQGILRGDRVEWSGDAPALPQDAGVRVHVTLLDKVERTQPGSTQGAQMAAALERVAACQGLDGIGDAAAWERGVRQDRPLPGRDQ